MRARKTLWTLIFFLVAVLPFGLTVTGTLAIEADYPPVGAMEEVDGVSLHYVDVGGSTTKAPGSLPVIVVHGASGNLLEPFYSLGKAFDPGQRVVFVDRPGHGWSERGGEASADPERQADLVAGLAGQLGIQKAVFVGHSLGAAVVAALAVRHPDLVAGLVFVAPATHPWPGGVAWYYSVAATPVVGDLFAWSISLPAGEAMMEAAAKSAFAPEAMPEDYLQRTHIRMVLRPSEFLANARDVAHLSENVTRTSKRYHEIKAPTVILTGDHDSVVYPSIHSLGLYRDIAGSRLVVLPGAGHMLHITHPQAVVDAVREVIADAAQVAGAS
ncbi:alpha/beta fold hydrolase [Hartmannibacter diazotrophicus]|uniref:alpha/beta fold hydrolase n=1 Tax=Hartmannibacter diazotrophicus TaxID=1482074 RepID=UPI000C148ABB|nr:alpha/beta hydrolase [Hartmannibacter diazotrophicus]